MATTQEPESTPARDARDRKLNPDPPCDVLHLSCGKPALRRLRDVWLSDSIDFNKFEHLDGREIDLNARATCDSCGEPWMFGIVGNDILAAV